MEKTKIIALTAILTALAAAVIVGAAFAQPFVGQSYAPSTGVNSQLPQTGTPVGGYSAYGGSGVGCSRQGNYVYGAFGAPQTGAPGYPVQYGMGIRGGMMGSYNP